jgi:hypothetical protein
VNDFRFVTIIRYWQSGTPRARLICMVLHTEGDLSFYCSLCIRASCRWSRQGIIALHISL